MTALLPYAFAKSAGVVAAPVAEGWQVSMRSDADPKCLLEVRRALGSAFVPQRVDARQFDSLLSDLYADVGLDAAAMSDTLRDAPDLHSLADQIDETTDLLDRQDDAPVVQLFNRILTDAARAGASDIHIEPYEQLLLVRMRADGLLRELVRLPARLAPVVVSRIKVMARLDIAERRRPQDGRITVQLGGQSLDVRVSTLPCKAGERVVLRLLANDQSEVGLADLGMPGSLRSRFDHAIAEPNGIILVTGPTGSGKTTTLYAALRLLNDGARNILTVEDPIEYAVAGVGQMQVNSKIGLGFVDGLRAILRQDPDIVMVGEIRDAETAEIAVQAALTGHLVLSSVHTNDAAGAITRLRDLGVEPFLLSSTVRMVLAQRLVRKLCADCKVVGPAGPMGPLLGLAETESVYRPHGCAACDHSGYVGRTGVFEMLQIDDSVRRLILADADEHAIANAGLAGGQRLADSARTLVRSGVTSLEDALRLTRRSGVGDAAL
jgi:general secretion pathway protein E